MIQVSHQCGLRLFPPERPAASFVGDSYGWVGWLG